MIQHLDDPITALLDRIREVAPDLSIADVRIIEGQGQNNRVIVVDERLIFRFPRYVAGVAKVEREIAILRAIRPYLAVSTPDPILTSFAETTVGKVFVGYPLIPGEPLWQQTLVGLADDKLFELGEQVGTFLRQLHAVPVAKVLPDELARFEPVAPWRDLYARTERQLFSFMRPDARAATSRHFAAFFERAGSLDIQPTLIHGDFGTGNILHDPATKALTGVIDFASAGIGDPAIDYAAVPGKPPAFFEGLTSAYPAITGAPDRVAFYRGTFALQEALFGLEEGDEKAFRAGIAPYV